MIMGRRSTPASPNDTSRLLGMVSCRLPTAPSNQRLESSKFCQSLNVRSLCNPILTRIALDGGEAPISRPFDKRLQLEARPAIKAVPEPVP